MNFAHISTWILTGGVAFLFIVGTVLSAKWIANKNIPVVSHLANGYVSTWKAAA